MRDVIQRFGPAAGALVLGTVAVWVNLLGVLPQLFMIDMSLRPNLPQALRGGVDDAWSMRNYTTLFTNDLHRAIFWSTIVSAAFVTLLALIVCYPIAYYLAQEVKGPTAAIFVLDLFVIGTQDTLTLNIASRVRLGLTPAVNAIGVIMIGLTVVGAVVYEILRRREAGRSAALAG